MYPHYLPLLLAFSQVTFAAPSWQPGSPKHNGLHGGFPAPWWGQQTTPDSPGPASPTTADAHHHNPTTVATSTPSSTIVETAAPSSTPIATQSSSLTIAESPTSVSITSTTPTTVKEQTTQTSHAPTTTIVTTPNQPSPTTSAAASSAPSTAGDKRGVAFNDPSLTSKFGLSQNSKISWSYNWASDPYQTGGTPNSYNDALAFIPMLWNTDQALTSVWDTNVANAVSQYGADAVLAFNEPDACCASCGNSCIAVSDAVSAYKQWMQPFAGTVQLGAPAVTNGVGANIGIDYMEQFMASCDGCTVDFIPIHWYGSVSDPNSFTSYVEQFHQQFGKPIWVTELGTNSGSEDEILAFLRVVLPWLDQQDYVQRYAYFMARAAGSPFLLETNGDLTQIGVLYDS